MNIKIAFFDIDNTLYDWASHRWIESGLEAIRKLKEKGIQVWVCSARPYSSVKEFGTLDKGIKWDGFIVSAGALAIYKGRYIYKDEMEPKDVRRFVRECTKRNIPCEYVTAKKRFMSMEPNEYCETYHKSFADPQSPIAKYKGELCTGVLMFAPECFDEEMKALFPNLNFFRFNECGVDVSPYLHVKGNAITGVLNYLGIPKEESIGFGDERQDMSMHGSAGCFVCVGNGHEEAKKVADYVSEPIAEDGIAKTLKRFGIIKPM